MLCQEGVIFLSTFMSEKKRLKRMNGGQESKRQAIREGRIRVGKIERGEGEKGEGED